LILFQYFVLFLLHQSTLMQNAFLGYFAKWFLAALIRKNTLFVFRLLVFGVHLHEFWLFLFWRLGNLQSHDNVLILCSRTKSQGTISLSLRHIKNSFSWTWVYIC
jgi:hypothetical protein